MPFFDPFGKMLTKSFNEVWSKAEDFLSDYKKSGFYVPQQNISDDSATLLFYLLTAKYGAASLATFNEDLFKYRVFSKIFQYGPTWERKMEVQKKIRALLDEGENSEIFQGTRQIFSTALNPGSAVTDDEILEGINEQRSSRVKRGKLEGYSYFLQIMGTDSTEAFVNKFKDLFAVLVAPQMPLYYTTEIEGEEENV